MRDYTLLLCLLFSPMFLMSQDSNDEEILMEKFQEHISYLSSDDLMGRATGSEGEKLAATYIISELRGFSIAPMGDEKTYLQTFEFSGDQYPTPNNFLYIDNKKFEIESDYIVIPESGNAVIKGKVVDVGYGIEADKIGYNDYENVSKTKGKILIMRWGMPEANNPHSKYAPYASLEQKVKTAKERGAIGIIFINQVKQVDDPIAKYSGEIQNMQMPMIFLNQKAYARIKNPTKFKVEMKTEFVRVKKKASNVLGYLDMGAENTIVLGAHYDHLGMGESGGSLHAGSKAIHNGADDNASGVAMVIELMRYAQNNNLEGYNYLAIFFTGEELGLFGSKTFVENPTTDLATINCMFNFDMVGRLNEKEPKLSINGVGTSPFWTETIGERSDWFDIVTTESGIGPSDHTSFYLNDIPAIHFFTGQHEDYHKPSDDEHLINYPGMKVTFKYVAGLLEKLNATSKIEFTPTKDDTPKVSAFKVTLGVMPDYMYDDGNGMRIDGVRAEKPAGIAGLIKGDIIIKMGQLSVSDIYSYMEALSKFDSGDSTEVVILREGEEMTKEIVFF